MPTSCFLCETGGMIAMARGANDLVNAPTSGLRTVDNLRAEPAR